MYGNYNNDFSYGRSSYPRSNNYSYSSKGKGRKKHSGAKAGVVKKPGILGSESIPYVRGWNYSRRFGLVSFFATEYSKTKTVKGATQSWQNWMVKVQPKMGKEFITSGLYSEQTGKVVIPSLGIVLNPSAPGGGYCGKFGNKRR